MDGQTRFVLVHGAWQGAGTWDLLVAELEGQGCRATAAVLTGLGTDAGSLTDRVTLQTHVNDVVRLLHRGDLHDVVLVGHSYAGMVVTGVAEEAHDRISRLVYVDGFVPRHRQSAMDLLPAAFQTAFREQANANGGWRLPASDRQLDLWGLKEGSAREFVRAHLSDFSIRCFEDRVEAASGAAATLRPVYIACVGEDYPARMAFTPFAEQARRDGWSCFEVPTGHACHVEMPAEIARLLIAAV